MLHETPWSADVSAAAALAAVQAAAEAGYPAGSCRAAAKLCSLALVHLCRSDPHQRRLEVSSAIVGPPLQTAGCAIVTDCKLYNSFKLFM
jgi:hypothetical protein